MSTVIIKGKPVDVGGGGDEIIRLRALLDKRNAEKRNLKQDIAERIEEKINLLRVLENLETAADTLAETANLSIADTEIKEAQKVLELARVNEC